MRNLCAALLVLLFAASLPAQDKPKPDTPEQAADKVLAMLKAKGDLKALAERDSPDPWLVTDELCFRGEHDAAEAFARAAPRPDTARLPEYVAAQRERKPDGDARAALAVTNRALADKKPSEALAAVDAATKDRSEVVSVRLIFARGHALRALRRLQESAQAFLAAAEAAEQLGWLARAVRAWNEAGMSCYYHSAFRGTLAAWEKGLRCNEARGNRWGMAKSLGNLGILCTRLGDYPRALEYQERSLTLRKELGKRAAVAATLGNIGLIYNSLGDYARALEYQERALASKKALGDRAGMAATLGNIGLIHDRLGDYPRGLEYHEKSLALNKEQGNRVRVAIVLGNIGTSHRALGDYRRALEYQERALKLEEELGDRAGVAGTLGEIGTVYLALADYARALEYQERSLELMEELGDRRGMGPVLGNLGLVYFRLGNCARALEYQKKSLKLREELGDRAGLAATLANIGLIYYSLEDYPPALENQEKALRLFQDLKNRAGVAITLGSLGSTHEDLGDYPRALECHEKALELKRELGDRAGVAMTLAGIGHTCKGLRDYPRALGHYEKALRLFEELGNRAGVAMALGNMAYIHNSLGDHPRALRSARQAVEQLPLLLGGLSGDLSASGAEEWSWFLSAGVRAAMRLQKPAEVAYFVESVRAGELRESLGGRKALWEAPLPASLLDLEQQARAAVATTRTVLARWESKGNREQIAKARAARDKAEAAFLAIVGRIQREAKAVADLAYPKAASLAQIQGALRPGEVLVSYALLLKKAVALVVDRDAARVVELATRKELEGVAAALAWARATEPWEERAAKARRALLDPLGLPEKTKRLLIAPDGALAYVPFALLAGKREVVLVPSGTTYGVLREEQGKRGKSVLALGDPDYRVAPDPRAVTVMRSGAKLIPLPGTRKEVEALGDVVLLRDRATESGLAGVLGKEERWRAVHFACHGLIRPDQPQLSSLALTPDDHNDGFLTVLEVFRMRIPADLVVLSACETAKGKVYKAEGVIGFTRAFMLAGAPRVIVSLWKVDDEATRALMVKFYELWNPKDRSKGLPTATALKKAQEFVRGHEKWKHPYYWAAWQLWGLPD